MELDTAARYDAPVFIAIGNDASWGAIALPQEREYNRTFATDLVFRRYEEIANVLGGFGEYVDTPAALDPAIQRALSSGVPSVVNVLISSVESRYMRLV
jgi:acetolactate synthase-1/2/3 large subunit